DQPWFTSVRSPGVLLLAASAYELLPGRVEHALRREAELLDELFERRRGAERVHADALAVRSHVPAPAERRWLLDRDARADRRLQDGVAVLLWLAIEQLEARHADDPGRHAFLHELLVGVDAQAQLAAGREQQHLGLAARRVREHVRTARDARCGRVAGAIERGQRLAAEDHHHRLVPQLHDRAPGLDDLVGVPRPDREQPRDGAERRQVLDGLMRRSVLAHTDRIVREDEDDG